MPTRRAGSLSRKSREARLADIKQQLSAFLNALDPLVKRVVFEPESVTWEGWGAVWSKRQPECSAARHEYERLAIQVPSEWRRYSRKVGSTVARLAEIRLLGHVRRPGAPRKTGEPTEHVLISELVADAAERLKKGWIAFREAKTSGGSCDDTLRGLLKNLGYEPIEQSAILNSKTLQGAAVFLVARQTDKKARTIWSSIRRARLNDPST